MEIENAGALGPEGLHERRRQAIALFGKGMNRMAIAPLVGARRNTVGRWIRDWQAGGARALRPAKPGRPTGSGRRLSPEREARTSRAIADRCPDQMKLPFAVWTRAAVRDYIARAHGIELPVRTAGRYLQRWGVTPRPIRRACERDEAAARRWMEERRDQGPRAAGGRGDSLGRRDGIAQRRRQGSRLRAQGPRPGAPDEGDR